MNHQSESRCTYTTARGHRCRMPRVNSHVSLCGTHLEAQRHCLRSESGRDAQDALGGVTDFRSATSVNHVLGNLTAMLTDNRIDYRKATVLAYLCQLLLQSISMANREHWSDPAANSLPLPPLAIPPRE